MGSTSSGSRQGSQDESDAEDEDVMELDDNDMSRLRAEAEAGDADAIWVLKNQLKVQPVSTKKQERKFVGFDEDDEFLSSDEDEPVDVKGKGKAVATA